MKRTILKALIFLIISALSNCFIYDSVLALVGAPEATPTDAETDGTGTPEKSTFLPDIWESVKKGLNATDEEVKDEEDKKIKEKVTKEGTNFEDPSEKTWDDKINEFKANVAKQDFVAKFTKGAVDLTLLWAQKDANNYMNNGVMVGGALVTAFPSSERADLSVQEKTFRTKRINKVRPALEKFLGEEISSDVVRNSALAFAGTGGGYRAMILTAGYLAGLEQLGLLDTLTYVAGLSGSTWMIGPWITQGGQVGHYKQSLQNKISSNQFNIMKLGPGLLSSTENIATITKNILWPKFLWGQPIRSNDFYGFLLGQVLLGRDGYKKRLSDQGGPKGNVTSGNYPFPIYTAVSMSKKDDGEYSYDWYEFNPYEVLVNFRAIGEKVDKFLSVPTRAFGSQFKAGSSVSTGYVTQAPEQMFGYWLGAFGSAFAINPKDIDSYIARGLSAKEFKKPFISFDGIMNFVGAGLMGVVQSIEGVGSARFSPPQVFNPFKGFSKTPVEWLKQKKYLTLVDAGVSGNIPLRPLLWPARKVKFIIIGESSTTVLSARELKRFFEHAEAMYGYTYSRYDDGKSATIRIYKDKVHAEAPRIIYLTYLKDPNLMKLTGPEGIAKLTDQEKVERDHLHNFIKSEKLDSFDPESCINGGDGKAAFCHTLNFEYTVDQFKQLAGIAEFNVRANKKIIENFIQEELSGNIDWGGIP